VWTSNKKRLDFLIDDHSNMVENLNRIGDDLLKAKWYFLASISAIGLAYYYVLKGIGCNNLNIECLGIKCNVFNNNPWCKPEKENILFFIICLVGNIIFWMISEYVISHGFLFRHIQAKAAKIEKEAYTEDYPELKKMIKDPTEESEFVKDENGKRRLMFDYMLPDQFNPLYWASFWIIIINTTFALFYSLYSVDSNYLHWRSVFLYLLISLPLVSKIWRYYIHKIKQFIETNCNFKIVLPVCNNNFFDFPNGAALWIVLIGILLGEFAMIPDLSPWRWIVLSVFLLFYFWHVVAGIVIHVLHNVFGLGRSLTTNLDTFAPCVHYDKTNIIVDFNNWKIFTKFKWKLCLLFHVV
jgi:hypothetical protein